MEIFVFFGVLLALALIALFWVEPAMGISRKAAFQTSSGNMTEPRGNATNIIDIQDLGRRHAYKQHAFARHCQRFCGAKHFHSRRR